MTYPSPPGRRHVPWKSRHGSAQIPSGLDHATRPDTAVLFLDNPCVACQSRYNHTFMRSSESPRSSQRRLCWILWTVDWQRAMAL
jgi:hypothetical protein